MSLNKVMLIGNVGAEPEVRYIDSAQAKVARMRIATTERYTDRSGETRENTEWHTVTAWRRQVEVIEKYVHKGTQIYVEGKLQTREWTDQNGSKRTSTEIVADNIQLLGRRDNSSDASAPSWGGRRNEGTGAPAAAGPGGYQPPYQPNIPAAAPQPARPAAAPAPAPTPASSQSDDFGDEGNDDLPF